MLSVYIHIPFCIKKCFYCDFLSFPADEQTRERYLEALLLEIEGEAAHYKSYTVDTVFIGGGTPSVLEAFHIENIMERLRKNFRFGENPEITIEINPGTVEKHKLAGYKRAGINRISIGTQSVRDDELGRLGRIHSAGEFFETFSMAREAGFDNINVDLMSALPGQTLAAYKETLGKIAALLPEHISAYSLIIEEGTPFFSLYGGKNKAKAALPLPGEEEERRMYEETERFLLTRGYHRYEISNYAAKGKQCRHNKAYWTRKDYVGLGLGAASMVKNVRFKNTTDLSVYLEAVEKSLAIKEEIQHLSIQEQMEEFMFLGLRLTEGVSRREFRQEFGQTIEEVYGEVIKKLYRQGLLEEGDRIRLTSYGRDVSNYVMSQFLF